MTPTIELLEAECAKRNWDVEMITALAWVLNRVEVKNTIIPVVIGNICSATATKTPIAER